MEPSTGRLDHRDALELAEATERNARAAITPSNQFAYTTWAIAWPLGFGARWITAGDDPIIDASWAGNLIYSICVIAAIVVTAAHYARRARGVTGTSSRIGRSWAFAWIAAFAVCITTTAGIGNVVSSDAAMDLIAACLVTFTGAVIYTAAGAVIDDRTLNLTGLWLLATCATAAIVGPYAHLAVIAVGGAIGFTAAAVATPEQR
ncbi:MAG: hypothetical protein AAFY28_11150 [Actinomycetota bacterium]